MKENILIVDDNFDTRNILKKLLINEKYSVCLAKNGDEAFDVLNKTSVDLILLDLRLKGGSGFEICKRIKNTHELSLIPIIFLSVSQLEEDIINAIECGSSDFIVKPFNNRILLSKVRAILSLKREEERLRKSKEELEKLIQETSNQKNLLSQESEFSQDLNHFLDAESRKNFIKEKLGVFLGVKLFTIFIIDEEDKEFKLFVTNHPDISPDLTVSLDSKSIMYDVVKSKSYHFINEYSKSRYYKSKREKYTSDIACSVPLISGERTIGVLNANDPGFNDTKSYDFEGRVIRISRHLAVSLHNTFLYEKVRDLSMRDSMTGLYNFRHFLETLKLEVERAKRYDDPLACIMLDVDDFKLVNDTYGHQAGDLVLKELAKSVSMSVRSTDIPARYGGDEFIVVLLKTDKTLAMKMSQRLMGFFSDKEIRLPEGKTLRVTISMGISGLPEDTMDVDELIKMADDALYSAKRDGKNRIVEFTKY